MSAPALFCCTDSGAFVSYDYYLGMDDEYTAGEQVYLDIYPNPADNYVYISYRLTDQLRDAFLFIITYDGKIVQQKDIIQSEGRIKFNTTELAPGLYLVEMKSHSKSVIRKLQINRH
jgi:hypothetical protein